MDTTKNDTCRNFDKLNSTRNGKEVSFDFKLFVIDQINNGQISANFASKKYNISRSTIHYWMKKLSNFNQKSENISKDLIIKRLKDKIEDLEAVKEFQQFIIAEFETVTGNELSKKFLPERLANDIQRVKKKIKD